MDKGGKEDGEGEGVSTHLVSYTIRWWSARLVHLTKRLVFLLLLLLLLLL